MPDGPTIQNTRVGTIPFPADVPVDATKARLFPTLCHDLLSIGAFCDHHVIDKFTWGLRKGNIPLGLCRAWDEMNVNGSYLIEESVLLGWVEELKSKEIIESFEIISD